MNINQYNQLDEATKLTKFHKFCDYYKLDPAKQGIRTIFHLALDDDGSTDIVVDGVAHVWEEGEGVPDEVFA